MPTPAPAIANSSPDGDLSAGGGEDSRAQARTVLTLVEAARKGYAKSDGMADIAAADYVAAHAWQDEPEKKATDAFAAEQDEIYPVYDTLASSLAIRDPSCAARSEKAGVKASEADYLSAQRVAATLTHLSSLGHFGEELSNAVRSALLFRRGGVLFAEPDPENGKVSLTCLRQYEVFIDPSGGRVEKANWAIRVIQLHAKDWKKRFEPGAPLPDGTPGPPTYSLPEGVVVLPDQELHQDPTWKGLTPSADQELAKAEAKLFPRYTVIEYWNFAEGTLSHLSATKPCFLMQVPIPYGNPFHVLLLDPLAETNMKQMPVVQRLLNPQRRLNQAVSNEHDIVVSNYQRTLINAALFNNDDKKRQAFRQMRPNDALDVDIPADGKMTDLVHVVQPAQMTQDAKQYIADTVTHMRYLAGADAFRGRGEGSGIRTAEEVAAMQVSATARSESRVSRIDTTLSAVFRTVLRILLWMIDNAAELGFDPTPIYTASQRNCSFEEWVAALRAAAAPDLLELQPYGAIKENVANREKGIDKVLGLSDSPVAGPHINIRRVLAELFQTYRQPPQFLADPPPEAGGNAGPPGAPAGPPLLPGEGALPGEAGLDVALPPLVGELPPMGGEDAMMTPGAAAPPLPG